MDCQATSFVSVPQCDPTAATDPRCLPSSTRREGSERHEPSFPIRPDAKTSVGNAFVQRSASQSIREVHAIGSRGAAVAGLVDRTSSARGAFTVMFLGSYDEVADQIMALEARGVTDISYTVGQVGRIRRSGTWCCRGYATGNGRRQLRLGRPGPGV